MEETTGHIRSLIDNFHSEDRDVRLKAQEELAAIGPAAVDLLIATLEDVNHVTRCRAACTLREIGDRRAVKSLIAALDDEAWVVRRAAARALGTLGDGRAFEPLLATLQDDDKLVRVEAVIALTHLGDERAFDHLATIVRQLDEDDSVRLAAVRGLGRVGGERAMDLLVAALEDTDWDVREAAVKSIGELRDGRAIEPVAAVLQDRSRSWYARQSAAMALGALGDARALDALISTLADPDTPVVAGVICALGEIADARAVEPLVAQFHHADNSRGHNAVDALVKIGMPAFEPVLAALENEDVYARLCAARTLGELGDVRALEPLLAQLGDPHLRLRHMVALAVCKIGGDGIVERLIDILADGDRHWYEHETVADALLRFCTPSPEPLLAALDDADAPNRHLRYAVTHVLGKLYDEQVIEPLIRFLYDDDLYVRRSAARSLERLGVKFSLDQEIMTRIQSTIENIVVLSIGRLPQNISLKSYITSAISPQLVTAESGREGLELVRRLKPDLIFLDMAVGDMDGQDVWQQIKTDDNLRHIPVVTTPLPRMPGTEEYEVLDYMAALIDAPFDLNDIYRYKAVLL